MATLIEASICELSALANRGKHLILLIHTSKSSGLPCSRSAVWLLHMRQASLVLLRQVSWTHLSDHGVLRWCNRLLIIVLTTQSVWISWIQVYWVSAELGYLGLTLKHHGAGQHWQT